MVHRRRRMLSAIILPLWASTAMAAGNGPVKSVTISSGGLVEVVRTADIDDRNAVSIDVPLDQVDDILKSLIVRDDKGQVKSIVLAGPNPVEETFRTLPFTADDIGALPRLLDAIKGTKVRLTGAREIEGVVLGVEQRPAAEGATIPMLAILPDSGAMTTVPLDSSVSVQIVDTALAARISDAALVAGRAAADRARTIEIGLDGQGSRQVDISYVVAAPIWKTSYRMITGDQGKARLQAWAVFENASGEDWRDVAVTLSSGKPVTLRQRLHQRYWADRTEVPVEAGPDPRPMADMEMAAAPRPSRRSVAGFGGAAAEPQAEAPIEMAGVDAAAIDEQAVIANFTLPGSYDVKNGDTISVPLIDKEVKAEMVSVFRVGSDSEHPTAAVMLDNDTGVSLPRGILTVYDDRSGYIGDAQISAVPTGEKRAAHFATDQKVSVAVEAKPQHTILSIKVNDGMIHARTQVRDVSTFKLSGAGDADRTLMIEQSKRPGWTFAAGDMDEPTTTHERIRVALKAGETKEVETAFEQTRDETFALADADPQMILSWANTGADDETRTKLKELGEARQKLLQAQDALEKIQREYDQLAEAQDRTRDNLRAVPNGDLQARYIQQMAREEDELAVLRKERADAQEIIDRFGGRVSEIIRTF